MSTESKTPRRDFLGKLAAGAGTTLVLPAFLASLNVEAAIAPTASLVEADDWFNKIKGKHKIVYDAPEPHDGFPIIWSWVFYKTNNATGTPDDQLTAVVVLRHSAIALALEDKLWEKYKFGEMFKINDSVTSAPAIRNPYNVFTDPKMMALGIEGIKALSARGVMFCVCEMALTVNSMRAAKAMNMTPEDIKKEWVAGLLPGVQLVPSGVWAVGRAQEHGCAYCFAG
jgi:intracellular sulfur oxidation DsrE/DsrF family protein